MSDVWLHKVYVSWLLMISFTLGCKDSGVSGTTGKDSRETGREWEAGSVQKWIGSRGALHSEDEKGRTPLHRSVIGDAYNQIGPW